MAGDVSKPASVQTKWLSDAVEAALKADAALPMRVGDNLIIRAVTDYDSANDIQRARIEITYDLR